MIFSQVYVKLDRAILLKKLNAIITFKLKILNAFLNATVRILIDFDKV